MSSTGPETEHLGTCLRVEPEFLRKLEEDLGVCCLIVIAVNGKCEWDFMTHTYHLHAVYSFRFPCRKRGLETDVAALQYAETERTDSILCAEFSSIRECD